MKAYFDQALRLSLQMPIAWDAAETSEFPLVLLAPPEDGFRANVGFGVSSLHPTTPEHLQQVINRTRHDRAQDYEQFKFINEARFTQTGYPGHIERYRWTLETNGAVLEQVFALILTSPDGLYNIHGTTLHIHAAQYLPIFEHIIFSIRFPRG
jgi:hypothetical protein